MAGKSRTYNPDTYGQNWKLCPEGPQAMKIIYADLKAMKDGTMTWQLDLDPIDHQWRLPKGKGGEERYYRCWLPEDGVVEALYDSMGCDPASVAEGRDYQPSEFVGRQVIADVYHKAGEKAGQKFANVRRLLPVFTVNTRPKHANPAATAGQRMEREPGADDDRVPTPAPKCPF